MCTMLVYWHQKYEAVPNDKFKLHCPRSESDPESQGMSAARKSGFSETVLCHQNSIFSVFCFFFLFLPKESAAEEKQNL